MTTPLPTHDDPRTYQILGAAFEVHRVLGSGFLELLYKDALAAELTAREIPFQRELPCTIQYKGQQLRGDYKMDFVCFGEIVLEIKARSSTSPADHAQVINYLAASKLRVALLLNFGTDRVDYKRFVRS